MYKPLQRQLVSISQIIIMEPPTCIAVLTDLDHLIFTCGKFTLSRKLNYTMRSSAVGICTPFSSEEICMLLHVNVEQQWLNQKALKKAGFEEEIYKGWVWVNLHLKRRLAREGKRRSFSTFDWFRSCTAPLEPQGALADLAQLTPTAHVACCVA